MPSGALLLLLVASPPLLAASPPLAAEAAAAQAHWPDLNTTLLALDAPCAPAGGSESWSCARRAVRAPPTRFQGGVTVHAPGPLARFGFAESDGVEAACEGHRRQTGQVEDDKPGDFSTGRLQVPRVNPKHAGFAIATMDPRMFARITAWADEHRALWATERPVARRWAPYFVAEEAIPGCFSNTHVHPFSVLSLDHFPELKGEIQGYMEKVLARWADTRLRHTSTYGMRVYRRHAMLLNHVDRRDTHLVSAVLQVAQACDPDGGWPIEVLEDDGGVHEVYLQPGQMLLYEGARLRHGRPMRFRGRWFGNIFTHFAPVGARDEL